MSHIKITIILFVLSLVLAFRFSTFFQNQPQYQDQQKATFTAILREEPKLVSGRQEFSMHFDDGARVKVLTGSGPLYHYGDRLQIDGIFTQKEYKDFSYLVIYFPKIQKAHSDGNIITESALFLRNTAKNLFTSTLPPVSSSLLLGILFGGKEGMPEDFYEKLRVTGVLHVVAASGMNVSFVAGALLSVLGLFVKRRIALVIGMCGIGFYAIVAGLEPSIVRASIMAVFAFSAALLGRQNAGLFALFLTGGVMLFVSPYLINDVGFQLSFLATLGIITVKPILPLPPKNVVFEDIGTTLAAQIATVPLMLSVFGKYGLLSLVANALVLWTIPVVMVIGSVSFLLSFIFAPLGKLVLFLALPFLLFFEQVIEWFGNIGWMWEIASLPWQVFLGYYMLLTAWVVFVKKRSIKKHTKDEATLVTPSDII